MILELKIHDSIADRVMAFLELLPKGKVAVHRVDGEIKKPTKKTLKICKDVREGKNMVSLSLDEHIEEIGRARARAS